MSYNYFYAWMQSPNFLWDIDCSYRVKKFTKLDSDPTLALKTWNMAPNSGRKSDCNSGVTVLSNV